jgi:hypothetical protein
MSLALILGFGSMASQLVERVDFPHERDKDEI